MLHELTEQRPLISESLITPFIRVKTFLFQQKNFAIFNEKDKDTVFFVEDFFQTKPISAKSQGLSVGLMFPGIFLSQSSFGIQSVALTSAVSG